MTTARRLIALLSALLLLPLLAVTAVGASASAAVGDGLFTPLPGFRPASGDQVRVEPREFRAFSVDLAGVRAALGGGGARTLTIPAPTGELAEFTLTEDSVMEPELQAAHPEIRTYSGRGPEGSSIRLDVTPMGFHAFVRNVDGRTWYVDPAENRVGETRVLSYLGGATPAPERAFLERELKRHGQSASQVSDVAPAPGGLVSTRTYRIAFLTDKSYADRFGSANVFAEKTTLINRVNEVYNDDLAIKFEMVTGTDTLLNFDTDAKQTGADGPCGANACFTPDQLSGCDGPTLDRNEFVLGQLIGAEDYDLGHLGLGVNGGGIAGLGVVGGPYKADGCTGLPNPTGDFYAIDYVSHEIGHQMGGNHTFNGTQVNCSPGNRNVDPYTTQVEPGSGSSIMAYAGICGSDNLQPHSDPYFSFASVDEINATTAAAPSNADEEQVVSFLGLDAGETFTLSCAGCPTSGPVSITGNPVTDIPAIASAASTATGVTVSPTPLEVSGYDGDPSPSLDGFTLDFQLAGSGVDVKTLTVQVATGTFTSLVGTIYNGGPTDERGAVAATTNNSPVVTAPADKTIPARTPFTLTGSAVDANAEPLTYMWEQTDPGGANGTGLVDNNKTDGPLFRQFGVLALVTPANTILYNSPGENLAGTSPSRTFPDLEQILAGDTNAATGSCPVAPAPPIPISVINCYSEFLPTSAWTGQLTSPRVLHFRLTARDEFTPDPAADHAGGLSSDDVALTVNPSAGPFLVTSRSAGGTASGPETVTWSVAGTDAATLAPNVKISLSTDGGLTFPTVLADSTPNDGSQALLLPNVTTTTARIKVEAVDNYFFDINDADFSITPSSTNAAPLVDAGPDATVPVGTSFTRTGSFSDETPATAKATVDYGDGAGPQPLTLTGTSFTLKHTYSTVGVRTLSVKVTDAGSLSTTDTVKVTVTKLIGAPEHLGDGKGKFASPKKSSRAVKWAKGKAKFRFTADRVGNVTSGNAFFKFKRGKVAFKGDRVKSASVRGKLLTLVVKGKNRGKGGYKLVVVALDRGAKDKIRVRLMRGKRVVYDSMPGKKASAKPRTRVRGAINVT